MMTTSRPRVASRLSISFLLGLALLGVACDEGEPGATSVEAELEPGAHSHRAHEEHRASEEHPAPEGHRKGVHHDFADVERWSAIFDDPERDAWQMPDVVVERLEIEPGSVVVDLGAGTGYFLPPLVEAVGPDGRVLALDPEPALVDHMRDLAERSEWATVEPRVIPYTDPALEDETVDRVLIVDTWHHIEDREVYVGALRRALRPGGLVMVVDFDLDSPEGPSRQHRLAPETVVEELEAGGLEAHVLDEPLPYQYLVVGALR